MVVLDGSAALAKSIDYIRPDRKPNRDIRPPSYFHPLFPLLSTLPDEKRNKKAL